MAPPHHSNSRSGPPPPPRRYGGGGGGGQSSYHHNQQQQQQAPPPSNGGDSYYYGGGRGGGADPRSDRRAGPGGREEGRGYHKSRDLYYQGGGGAGAGAGGRPRLHHHGHGGGHGGGRGGHHGGGGHGRGGVERYADGRRKVANYDFEASILRKIGSCNMPVYFSFETLTSAQLKDENLFKNSLPPGMWMTPELPIRVTKVTCTLKELLRFVGTYLLAEDNGNHPERIQVQKTVTEKIPAGTPISVFLYKQIADEKDLKRPIDGVAVDCLVEGQPLSMLTVQSLEEASKELASDPEKPNDPFHRPVFDSRSSRDHTYNGNGIFIVCPTATTTAGASSYAAAEQPQQQQE